MLSDEGSSEVTGRVLHYSEKGELRSNEACTTVIYAKCQTIGSTGITPGIVAIDENYLEELSVSARQCAALYTQRKDLLCGAEYL